MSDQQKQKYFLKRSNTIYDRTIHAKDDEVLVPEYLEESKKKMKQLVNLDIHSIAHGESTRATKTAQLDSLVLNIPNEKKVERNNPKKNFTRMVISEWAEENSTLNDDLKLFAYDQKDLPVNLQELWVNKKLYPAETNTVLAVSHTMPIKLYLTTTRNTSYNDHIGCAEIFTNRFTG